MNAPFPTTLALDLSDLIGLGVVLLVTFGSAVGTWISKQAEARKAARQRERALMSPHALDQGGRGPRAHPPGSETSAETASERREVLREMARKRARMQATGQISPTGGSAPGGQPANLTMAERIARARAQQQYAQRAEDLRAQAERSQQAQQQQAQRAALQRQRQAAQAKRQREAELRARAQKARARQQQAARAQRAPQTQRPRQTVRQTAPAAAAPVPRGTTRRRSASQPSGRRIARGATAAAVQPRSLDAASTALDVNRLSRESLRQAFILKEILDQPVAMREPGAHGLL